MTNPLLSQFNTPHATPPFHAILDEHFMPAFEVALQKARAEVDAVLTVVDEPNFKNTIEAIESIGGELSEVSSIFFNLNHAHTNATIQNIAREVSPLLTEFANDIWLNNHLFLRVKAVYDTKTSLSLTDEQLQLLDNTYKAFVRKGALLSSDDKLKYREISTELSDLGLQFGENVLSETNDFHLHITDAENLLGLPDAVIEAAAEQAVEMEKEGWIFTLHMPSFLPFMKYSQIRSLRQQMFIAFSSRANRNNDKNNQENIKRITSLRLAKSKLLGFNCYADYVLDERMAKGTSMVNAFLNNLLEASLPLAHKDVAEIAELAKRDGLTDSLQKWDFAFYTEKLKEQKFGIDDEILKPFFKLENVEAGVLHLATRLYGLTFKISTDIPVYHDDVKVFEVFDEDGSFLSVLYVDYFPRPSKQGGAWMTSYREQHKQASTDIRPCVSLVMNFSKPTETLPSLLNHNEVLTFLHEFGHALHGMLSNVTYESLSGTNVYRDFVELPSQIMENWGYEKEWLLSFAKHHITSEPLPEFYIDKIIESSQFQSGYAMVRQLSFGLMDMAWHTLQQPYNQSVAAFEESVLAPMSLMPNIDGTSTCTAFSHIFDGGYAAGYYGYKWAEVLDADAFELFKQNGIFNKQTATLFRQHILAKGGTAHPLELYKAFRGQDPSIEPLLARSGLK